MTVQLAPGLPEVVIREISHGLREDWHRFSTYIGFTHAQLENFNGSIENMGLCFALAKMLESWGKVAAKCWSHDKSLKFLGKILEEIDRRDILESLDIQSSDENNLTLDDHIMDEVSKICLSYKWPSNIDAGLVSRIEKWKEESMVLCGTRAYRHILHVLDQKSTVLITGNQGDGKTFLAQQILLHYLCLDFELVLVNSPEDWRQKWNPSSRQIIFIDDAFGETRAFPYIALQEWAALGQEMSECLEGGFTKVISTVSDYILEDCETTVRGVDIFKNVVNISDMEWNLMYNERIYMLASHAKFYGVKTNVKKLKDIADNDDIHGFPLRCRLFFSNDRLNQQGSNFFLGHLVDVLTQEFNYIIETDKLKYLALVMLSFNHGVIPDELTKTVKDNNFRSKIVKFFGMKTVDPLNKLFCVVISELGLPSTTSLSSLYENLHSLTGTYVTFSGGSFRFVHEAVAEAVSQSFGGSENHQPTYLTYCSLPELQQRVQLESGDKPWPRNPIYVHKTSYPALAARLTLEVLKGNALMLLGEGQFFKPRFSEYWKTFLFNQDRRKLFHILEMKDKRGNTFTNIIARKGCVPLLSLIVETSFVPIACHLMLQTASAGHTDAVEMLLNEGADIDEKTALGQTALLLASVEGHLSLADMLLDKGADINITDVQGCCPLHSASAHGQLEIVRRLIDKGANVDVTDNIGSTAVFYAALEGHVDVVGVLMEHGADVTITNSFGGNPFLASCVNGHLDVLLKVLRSGVGINLNQGDFKGKTALHWSCQRGYTSIVKLLITKGADVNVTDYRWQTPLHLVAMNGHTHIWRMLIKAGADMSMTDKNGQTPVALANKESKIPMLFE